MEEVDYQKSHRHARRQAAKERRELNEWRPRSAIFEDRKKGEKRRECRRKYQIDE